MQMNGAYLIGDRGPVVGLVLLQDQLGDVQKHPLIVGGVVVHAPALRIETTIYNICIVDFLQAFNF